MLAARMVQTFDFSEPSITQRLRFEDGDWDVGPGAAQPSRGRVRGRVDIIDLDDKVKRILHPGNASDRGRFPALSEDDTVSVSGH